MRSVVVIAVGLMLVLGFVAGCGDDDGDRPPAATPTATPLPTPISLPSPDLDTGPFYADTAWATVHGDSRNSDYSPFFASTELTQKWGALDGATMFLSPTVGPEGHVYATTGRGEGYSHLHCFDRDGNLLWESAVQQSLDDLDYAASINAPIVDTEGDVYVGDLNQLWAFHPNGEVKWVTNIAELGATGHFVTPIFSKEGLVGGISTDGKVMFFDRETGLLAGSVLDLPGVPGPVGDAAPPGIMGGGLLEPSFIQPMWNLIWGKEIEVANTPAVSPETGRIFISAGGPTPESGVLYGIDTAPDGPTIAFTAPMGPGSGTSPALSPDSSLVYAADDAGVMYAVDAETGEVVWEMADTMAAASPAVGPDGTVYSYSVSTIVALDGQDGTIKWKKDYDSFAEDYLPEPSTGFRTSRVNCVLTLSPGIIWAAINADYATEIAGQVAPIPHKSLLVAIDTADGTILGVSTLRDTSSALTEPDADGVVYASLSGIANSVYYYALNPALPEDLRVTEKPLAGLVALRPLSFAAHTRGAIDWADSLAEQALANASAADAKAAINKLETARAQLRGTYVSLQDAVADGELDATVAASVEDVLKRAEASLYEAVTLLQEGNLDIDGAVTAALDLLQDALVELTP